MTDRDALIKELREHAELVEAWGKFELGRKPPPPLTHTETMKMLNKAADMLEYMSGPVVTDEMVEAASNAEDPYVWEMITEEAKQRRRPQMRRALESALNVSQPGVK